MVHILLMKICYKSIWAESYGYGRKTDLETVTFCSNTPAGPIRASCYGQRLRLLRWRMRKLTPLALLIQQTQKTACLISPVEAFGSRFKNRNSIFPRRTPIQIRFIADFLIKFFLGIKQGRVGPYPAVRPVALNPAFFSDSEGT